MTQEIQISNKLHHRKYKAGLVTLLIGLTVCISVTFNGYIFVDENEFVLVRDLFTRQIDEQVYETGRHWVGIGKTCIIFPKNIEKIVFDTIEGSDDLPITIDSPISAKLDAIFQFKLDKSSIISIYREYTNYANFKDAMLYKIWAIVAECMQMITYEDLYFNRSIVNNAIFEGIQAQLTNSGVNSILFQITEIEFPETIQNAFNSLQQAMIDQKVASEEQKATLIRAKTLILEAYSKTNISLIEAQNDAEILLLQAKTAAQALNITLTMDSYSLGLLMNATYTDSEGNISKVFNSTSDLLGYLWIQALNTHESAYLILGDTTPLIQI